EHSVGKVPVILACGMREMEDGTVTVRRLGQKHTSVETFDAVKGALAADALAPDIAAQVQASAA
ncbi:MAG: hypothetical protein AAFZ10_13390, partial [Pseudomonadota bacterium]